MEQRLKKGTALFDKSTNKLPLLLLVFIFIFLTYLLLTSKALAQVPDPYVKCSDDTQEPEWHSLRPYQASPCTVPIVEEEQALLCGSNLVVRDTFTVQARRPECPPNPCPGPVWCHYEELRDFDIYNNPFESQYPIAGNTELIPGDETSILPQEAWRLKDFLEEDKLPPDPEEIETLKDYWIEYQEWRGKECSVVHIDFLTIHKEILICYEDLDNPNFWANIFPLIPYSSTEDRIGKLFTSDMFNLPEQTTFDVKKLVTEWRKKDYYDDRNATLSDQESALYFPHMEENVELTNLLQTTYLPQIQTNKEQPIGETEAVKIGTALGGADECKILDIRSNPGDQLFGEQVAADVSYTAVFDCLMENVELFQGSGFCVPRGECTQHGTFSSSVDTYTPMIDELWSKTVSGNASVFKKTFPKVEENAPVDKIKDIPASSTVEYRAEGSGATLLTQNPTLYFPHLGGIYDYFLKDMQTLLRPKGFAEGPAGLSPDSPIAEVDRTSEYLSWYLNGTIYRAEQNPLDANQNCIGDSDKAGVCSTVEGNSCMVKTLLGSIPNPFTKPDGKSSCMETERQCCIPKLTGNTVDILDRDRIINFAGPLNKLLPQSIQWRAKVIQPTGTERISRVGEIERAAEQLPEDKRHNQIVGCTIGITVWIPFKGWKTIGGFPTACNEDHMASVGLVPEGTPSPSATPSSGTCPSVADSEIDTKYLSLKSNFIRMANNNGGCHMAEECFNYVVRESTKAGVNPALTLTLWLHESNASDYCSNPGVEDFGIHTLPGEDIVGQLARWLEIGKTSAACSWCYNQGGWAEPMQAFLYNYWTGACDPGGDQSFYDDMKTMFQWVNDPVAYCLDPGGTGFKINCPNDMSCP